MNLYVDEQTDSEPLARKSEPQSTMTAKVGPVAGSGHSALLTGIMVVIALALGGGLWSFSRRLAPQITAPVSADVAYAASFPERSIAVLPFDEHSESSDEMTLAQAIQDDIIN